MYQLRAEPVIYALPSASMIPLLNCAVPELYIVSAFAHVHKVPIPISKIESANQRLYAPTTNQFIPFATVFFPIAVEFSATAFVLLPIVVE